MEKLIKLLNAAAVMVLQESHDSCGAYSPNPELHNCAVCVLEATLRDFSADYGIQQKLRAESPPGSDSNKYGKMVRWS